MPDRYLGRTIGKYRVTRHLGTGAFSWVYEAVDQDLEIPVALKILRPEFAGQDTAESRFRKEATTAARLRHPHIVTVRDVGSCDGAAFVAMDLHPLTLGRRLALVERLPEPDVVRLGIGIAAALAVAHASHVVHRDIKPDNILLDQHGEAVVADFGLARALAGTDALGDTSQVQGTPHYFSPEQARGRELDGRSDLYSLGVTLFRAATGVLPFDGDDWYDVARRHIETPPPSPRGLVPELSEPFEVLLLRLLAKDPEDRPASAVLVIDALAALPTAPDKAMAMARLGSHTVDAFAPSTASRPRRWPVAAALLAAAALGGWFVWRQRLPENQPTPDAAAAGAPVGPDPTVGADSLRLTGVAADSEPPGAASAAAPTTTDGPSDGRPPARASVIVPRTARLDFRSTDSATLYVDNRAVGAGRWRGDVAAGGRHELRAVLADAPISCPTASRDTVLTGLRAGDRVTLELPVTGCTVVRYRVEPRDARVQFTPLEGGRAYETRADSVESYSLPWGRYLMRVSAPYCIVFSDTVVVTRAGSATVIPRKLVCS